MNCIDCRYSLLKDGHYNCTYEEGECIKINVLEKENAELARNLEQTEKDLADYQFNYPTIKELQEEIAELKEEMKAKQVVLNDFKSRVETVTDRFDKKSSQLAKAREILQKYIRINLLLPIERNFDDEVKLFKEAEQFLKEV